MQWPCGLAVFRATCFLKVCDSGHTHIGGLAVEVRTQAFFTNPLLQPRLFVGAFSFRAAPGRRTFSAAARQPHTGESQQRERPWRGARDSGRVWRVRSPADYRWSGLNFTPIRSAPRHTTVQCRMALSKSSSNFGGSAAALGSHIAAPVDEKFRTVQSITDAPLPIIIWPDLRTRCRGAILRSPRSCGKIIVNGQRECGGPLCRTR
jgi:hypothetical protein